MADYEILSREELIIQLDALKHRIAILEADQAERNHIEDTLRTSESKYRVLLDESSDPIFAFYPDGTYRYVNRAFADGVGRSLEMIMNKRIWDVFPQDEADKRYAVVKWVFANAQMKVIEVRVPRPDGDRYYITTVKPVLSSSGDVTTVICISKEITDRKLMEQELVRISTHDLLTGIYNRNFFEVELERLKNSRLFPISIIIADLDQLKIVNDRYGHQAGDELLQVVAQVLKSVMRTEDVVARLGGDEFAVLLPQTDEEEVASIVERLRARLDMQEKKDLKLSIGFATGTENDRLDAVMRLADDRMYLEKVNHKKLSNSVTGF
ncbi:MAG: diguanylate cyclase [Chloroflexi bacterium HGW-Chloroflexi-10]|nr:MAG: diguanylate cyclase [Chloroflexi bacterium HGW-Chloroflexi-10]